jgi:hypothetical protein
MKRIKLKLIQAIFTCGVDLVRTHPKALELILSHGVTFMSDFIQAWEREEFESKLPS